MSAEQASSLAKEGKLIMHIENDPPSIPQRIRDPKLEPAGAALQWTMGRGYAYGGITLALSMNCILILSRRF